MELKLLKDIKLNEGQERALAMVRKLRDAAGNDTPVVGVLTGFAGSGKTTTLRAISKEMGGSIIVTPTGKAAVRVTEATGLPASTIHRWLYKPSKNVRTSEVVWKLKEAEDFIRPPSGLVIVDEASMVDLKLWADVQEACSILHCNVLLVGDSFQLPPVTKGDEKAFSVLDPGFPATYRESLTEIQRQALDSPIIRASMLLRQGKWMEAFLDLPHCSPANFVAKGDEVQRQEGVVLVYTNAMRHETNKAIRNARGLTANELVPGEPLLVKNNSYEVDRFNGELVTFEGWDFVGQREVDVYDHTSKEIKKTRFGRGKIDGKEVALAVAQVFGQMDNISKANLESAAKKNVIGTPFLHANLGYTLSYHASQGSEWPNVLVGVDKYTRADNQEGRRALYTAITRASKEVTMCWNPVISS